MHKVTGEVFDALKKVKQAFIDDDAILMHHISKSWSGITRPLNNVTSIQLAKYLIEGYELEGYNEDNIPSKFKFYHAEDKIDYTIKKSNDLYIIMWKDENNDLECTTYELYSLLNMLNSSVGSITKVLQN